MTCCGRPMQQEGDKWVCGKCGAWNIPGFTAVLRALEVKA